MMDPVFYIALGSFIGIYIERFFKGRTFYVIKDNKFVWRWEDN